MDPCGSKKCLCATAVVQCTCGCGRCKVRRTRQRQRTNESSFASLRTKRCAPCIIAGAKYQCRRISTDVPCIRCVSLGITCRVYKEHTKLRTSPKHSRITIISTDETQISSLYSQKSNELVATAKPAATPPNLNKQMEQTTPNSTSNKEMVQSNLFTWKAFEKPSFNAQKRTSNTEELPPSKLRKATPNIQKRRSRNYNIGKGEDNVFEWTASPKQIKKKPGFIFFNNEF